MVAVAVNIFHFKNIIVSPTQLPNNGLSEVTGMVFDTNCKNTVKLSSIVTPEKEVFFNPSVRNRNVIFLAVHANQKSATFFCKCLFYFL